ncbi:MAG TPA: D-TA family PLP-dependent enzyme [Bryobacteraceae bacterium]|nr:D-TA family PLP-dependent enzyme [Bryobacteraceae bacterium]
MKIDELDTPAVLIDLDRLERNIERMARYCREHGLALRPHTKTHKNPDIAKMQIAAGACGITVAKPGEAEIMVNAGIDDILLAYPIVSAQKAGRVADLATRARLRVSLDSREAIECLSRQAAARGVEIGILVEIDAGFGRCGVGTPEAALALAREVAENPAVRFDGLMFYPGHIKKPAAEQPPLIDAVNQRLDAHYEAFERAGIPITVVSGGSTATAFQSHLFHGLTEIRPGMYAFLDRNMVTVGVGGMDECAISVLVTVVSDAVPNRAMVDGGSKTFSSDALFVGDGRGFGWVIGNPDIDLIGFSEEHGHLDVSRAPGRLHVGERLRVVPNHVCTTINMHDRVFGIRGDRVDKAIDVTARGRVQ